MNKLYILSEIPNYDDKDAFVSDLALSSSWNDAPEDDIPEDRINYLAQLWDDAHSSIKELAAANGLSIRKLAETIGVPYRTAEDWSAGKSTPPLYVRLLIAESLRK